MRPRSGLVSTAACSKGVLWLALSAAFSSPVSGRAETRAEEVSLRRGPTGARPPVPVRDNVWGRALRGAEEERLRASLIRLTAGLGDDRDAARARMAWIESSRGRPPRDPRAVVLLVHFRLELLEVGAPPPRDSSARLLADALEGGLGGELRGWAAFDRARLLLLAGETGEVEALLSTVVTEGLDGELVSRGHLLRGFLRLGRVDYQSARDEFRAARELGTDVLGQSAAACAEGVAEFFSGHEAEARRLLRSSSELLRRASNASGRSPWAGLPLGPPTMSLLSAFSLWGEALRAEREAEPEKAAALLERARATLAEAGDARARAASTFFASEAERLELRAPG